MRVVITGMGAITPAGNDINTMWERVVSGVTCVDFITAFDHTDYKCHYACEVKDFDPSEYGMDSKAQRRNDRYTQFALAAADMAWKASGLEDAKDTLDLYRCGVIFGSGIGGINTFETEHAKLMEKGPNRVSPLFIPMLIANIACGSISIKYGFKGTCFAPVTACASSTHAIGEAFRNIKHGYADIIISGGAEAPVSRTAAAGFANMTALTHGETPDTCSLPFDSRRSGFTMAEGGGVMILESLEHAQKRGATIYGEIVGYGSTGDAFHITAPSPEGESSAMAMKFAAKEAGIEMSEIGYMNAHGTGTEQNDKTETLAMKNAFGDHAYKISISSTKGVTGHLLGAAGAVEAIITALAIEKNTIPPTANLTSPDPELDLNYTPLTAAKKQITYAMSNSLGFGGSNATIVLKKYS